MATIFPILFAGIMGRFMYQMSRWKLEKGAAISTLEQLLGSRTIGSTVVTHFQLRSFNLLGISLIFAWAFSPFGGQSILRMLGIGLKTVIDPSTIFYFDSGAQNMFSTIAFISGPQYAAMAANQTREEALIFNYTIWAQQYTEETMSILDSCYNMALTSPDSTKNSTMDIWGNVKIPFLSSFGDADSVDWQDVPTYPHMEYSALAGIPIVNTSVGNTTFELESTYVSLECANISTTWLQDVDEDEVALYSKLDKLSEPAVFYNDSLVPNGTWQGHLANNSAAPSTWEIAMDRFVDRTWYSDAPRWGNNNPLLDGWNDKVDRPGIFINDTGVETETARFLIQAHILEYDLTPGIARAECSMSQQYVESRVMCTLASLGAAQNCTVIQQRRSSKPHGPESITSLSFPAVFGEFSFRLPRATRRKTTYIVPDPSLLYIQTPIRTDNGFNVTLKLDELPEKVFSTRLSQIMNTYLLITQGLVAEAVNPLNNLANITTEVSVENLVEVYAVNQAWIAGCIISCLVLLVGGILSVIFVHLAKGPEVLGYVSTAVRDSKYVRMPQEAGQMGGMDLTRVIGEQRVRHGLARVTEEGVPILGVGKEEEIETLNKRHSRAF